MSVQFLVSQLLCFIPTYLKETCLVSLIVSTKAIDSFKLTFTFLRPVMVVLFLSLLIILFLSIVVFKVNNPFIVCMTYAFQTPDKLCFVLDLMNGRYCSMCGLFPLAEKYMTLTTFLLHTAGSTTVFSV